MEITERWLMDTVGFPAFKAGRQLYRGGAVAEVSFEADLLRGILVAGGKRRTAGLKINGPTDIDNLCRCPQSQREGSMCAHSVALAFAWMNRSEMGNEESTGTGKADAGGQAGASAGTAKTKPATSASRKQSSSALPVVIVRFEQEFLKIWEKGKCPLRLQSALASASESEAETLKLPDSAEALAACARFSTWLQGNGVDFASPPPFLVLNHHQAMDFFAAARDYPWLRLGESDEIRISSGTLRPPVSLSPSRAEAHEEEIDSDEALVRLTLETGAGAGAGKVLWSQDGSAGLRAWIFDAGSNTFYPLTRPDGAGTTAGAEQGVGELLAELLDTQDGVIVERPMSWVVANLEALNEAFAIDDQDLDAPIRIGRAEPVFELELEGSLNSVSGQLLATYRSTKGDIRIPAGSSTGLDGLPIEGFPFSDPDQPGRYWQRNLARENAVAEQLDSFGFRPADDRGRWVLRGREAVLAFFGSELPEWRRSDQVNLKMGERLRRVTHGLERLKPQITIEDTAASSAEAWFECEFGFSTASGISMTESEVRRLLSSGRREIALPPGATSEPADGPPAVGVIDTAAVNEWSEVLEELDAEQTRPGHFRIAAHHREFLANTVGGGDAGGVHGRELEAKLKAALGDLEEKLRSYQADGVAWMCRRLLQTGLRGAVLADEMGLGKTVQTLATIRALRTVGGEAFSARPALVVAPTSLLANWAAEAARFTPELKVIVLHGSEREKAYQQASKAGLVITSYGVLARDVDKLAKASISFGLAVLDEASFVRNPKTRIAKAVRRIDASARLALTGTPVENSVRDLWSIVDFALPGCLGASDEFKQRYEAPLTTDPLPVGLLKRLKRRVDPHLLRRTKRVVASELPEKIEQVLYCDLAPEQKALYAQMVEVSRETMRTALGTGGAGANQARMAALTTLLRLRQLCCDPGLLNLPAQKGEASSESNATQASGMVSAKMAALKETIREVREGGHRVLVFSQFVRMLKLIGGQLADENIEYAYLDGSTSASNRAAEVKRFQNTPDLSVFLISLKAGGYGLNLTAADTVIHYDPWWNPAVEAQATDRAHRIGQERPVTSYKLICRGTVEEKILRLQQRKAAAFGAAIGIDEEAPMMRGLNDDDLREVLEI